MSRFSGRSHLSSALQGTPHTVLPPIVPMDEDLGRELWTAVHGGNEALQDFSSRLQQLVRLTGVAIALEQNGEAGDPENPVVCVASSGPAAPPHGTPLDRSRGLSAECLRTRETRISNDAFLDPRVNREACRRNNIRSTVVVPLLLHGEPVGILGVFSDRPGYFTDRQVFLLEFIASFVSHASAIAPPGSQALVANREPAFRAEDSSPAATSAAPEEGPSKRFALGPLALSPLVLSIAAAVVVTVGAAALFFARSGASRPAQSSIAAAASGATGNAPAPQATSASAGQVLGAGTGIAGSVEHWSSPGYTRITIHLDHQRQPDCGRLPDPERLYCDFDGLTFPADYAGEDFQGDPLVAGLRVGEYRSGVARVVFDLKAPAARHAIAVLDNPPRLIVELMQLSKMGLPESSSTAPRETVPSSANSAGDAPSRAAAAADFTIVIDPGHGGRDTGAIGPAGLKEKDLALDVARRLAKMLRSRLGARVILTRTTDRYLSLEARSQIANRARANLFLSIHCNGSDYASAKGIETYYLGESASSKDAHVAQAENESASNSIPHLQLAAQSATGTVAVAPPDQSRQLAEDVQESLYKAAAQQGGTRDRGVRTAPFVVLKDARMPAVLAEISFLSSKAEEQELMQPAHRQALADGLFQGIATDVARSEKFKAHTLDSAALR